MRTQYGEKKHIKEQLLKIIADKECEPVLPNAKKERLTYLINFQKLIKGNPKRISFHQTLFAKDGKNIVFDLVKVNNVKLDNKYYYCGFRSLREIDSSGYIQDEILKEHSWVKNNTGILYLDLKVFIILYTTIARNKRKKCNLLERVLLKIINE